MRHPSWLVFCLLMAVSRIAIAEEVTKDQILRVWLQRGTSTGRFELVGSARSRAGNVEGSIVDGDTDSCVVTYDGEAFEIGFNARYFQDALGVVRDEDVNLAFNDAFSPVLIKSPSDPGFKAVIMPMRL